MTPDLLVFGATGQVGSEVLAQAAASGLACRAVPRQEADLTEPTTLHRTIVRARPRVVVNCAAYTNVDQAEAEPDLAHAVNATAPAAMARACAELGAPLIHISTDYVFDGESEGPYAESDAAGPINVYGRSKLAGEEAVRTLWPRHVILRTSWVYGVTGRNFVRSVIRLAAERDELRVVADQRGCPTFARDLARAILAVSARLPGAPPDLYGTYHCCGGGETTWHGLASETVALQAELTGRRPPVRPIPASAWPTAARRPANSVLDCRKVRRVFGIQARSWRASLAEAVPEIVRTRAQETPPRC